MYGEKFLEQLDEYWCYHGSDIDDSCLFVL
jgi:hypothetical protein